MNADERFHRNALLRCRSRIRRRRLRWRFRRLDHQDQGVRVFPNDETQEWAAFLFAAYEHRVGSIRGHLTPPVFAPSLVMSSYRVVGQLEVVAHASGEEQLGDGPEVHYPHHQVAKPDAQPRLCREDREKLLCGGLFVFDQSA